MKCIACAFRDKSHTVVPVIYSVSIIVSLYLSYILLRLVNHPRPSLSSYYYVIYNLYLVFNAMFYRHNYTCTCTSYSIPYSITDSNMNILHIHSSKSFISVLRFSSYYFELEQPSIWH